MDIQNSSIVHWFKDIDSLRVAGRIICPLMIVEPARFPASICPCDIPKARARFFAENPSELLCCVADTCLPTQEAADTVGDERNPSPVPRTRRLKGAWTTSSRKLPEIN